MEPKTVTVNGTVYDSRTGMPLRKERGHEKPHHHAAQHVHAQPQRSKTLNRRYVALHTTKTDKPKAVVVEHARTTASAPTAISVHHKPSTVERPSRSDHITKFAKHPHPTPKHRQVGADIAPVAHPVAAAAHRAQQAQKQPTPELAIRPSQVIKQEAIEKALAQSTPKSHKKQVTQAKKRSKTQRFMSTASASLAIALLAGYFTYLNMPAISTRVAAAQAGIDASYPGYRPSGYSLSGPVAYDQGSVSMKFAANAGPQTYTLTQSNSDWDSSAVLENSVLPSAGDEYTTTTTSGLTIYHYDNKAVWVNKGILYTITGGESLSNDQVQNIATSL